MATVKIYSWRDDTTRDRPASVGDSSAAGRKADLAMRTNVLHGQFFERGKFAWVVICSAHGVTSIVLIPDDDSQTSVPKTIETPNVQSAPDTAWIERDRAGGWGLNTTIFLSGASQIDRAHDGAKLDRVERARPVHDGITIADMLDGSGYTLYWTGRRWIQVASYD